MKRVTAFFLFLALLLTACTGAPVGVASSRSDASGAAPASKGAGEGEGASESASSGAASGESAASGTETSSRPAVEPVDLFDVDAAVKAAGLSLKDDVSSCFPKDAAGYVVNRGPYLVDAATVVRLTTARVEGAGSVKWKDYQIKSALAGERAFDGVIPVTKLNDPIYTCMNLPAEADYFEGNLSAGPSWGPFGTGWNNRINAFNMTPVDDTFNNILCMGAVIPAFDGERRSLLKEDDEFTLCMRNFVTLYHSTAAGRGWTVAQQTLVPPLSSVNHLYALPWNIHVSRTLRAGAVSVGADHAEIKLKGSDFLGDGDKIEGYTFHYWDKKAFFSDLGVTGGQIDGFVMAVTVWVKEPAMANKLITAIGADIRFDDENGKESKGAQLNNGRPCLIPAEPRVLVSHSVGPNSVYDSVMDSETVQKLIGMK